MTPVRTALVSVSICALAASLMVMARGQSSAASPSVAMWLTTGDQSNLLTSQPASAIRRGDRSLPTITVDPTRRYQPIEGFGASLTASSAYVISRSPKRDAMMQDVFGRDTGIGLNYLRQPMGASDFVPGPFYTYDDMPAGQTDYGLARFSLDPDRAEILPLLVQARQLNPELKVMAAPWSPPAWMKTGESLIGGRLIDDDRVYQTYANYFVKFLQGYAAAGVPVEAVSVQNEPQNRYPKQYPGTDLRPEDEVRLIRVLGPALSAAGLDTKIHAFDHNWAVHPDDQAYDPPPDPNYALTVLADDQARQHIAGVDYHCYYGDPAAQSQLHDAYPDVGIYFTECSGVRSAQPENTFRDTLRWQTRNIVIGAIRNWARTTITWNLALDPSGGPHNGGCGICTGVVTVDGDQVTRNAEYYVLGHASKFVQQGAVRIESNVPGNLGNVAFRNPDGSIVLVVLNDTDAGRTPFTVRVGSASFSATLPAGAVATFVKPASGSTTSLKADERIEAESYDEQYGTQTESCADIGGGTNVGWIANGDWLAYRSIDFGSTGMNRISLRIASGSATTGTIDVRLDDRTSGPIGSLPVSSTGGWQSWVTRDAPVSNTTAVHTVYLTFRSDTPDDFVNVNWLTFASDANASAPYRDPAQPVTARVEDLLSRMSLDDKLGQMTQAERGAVNPQSDIATYRLGSLLSGGGSAPSPNTASSWADMYDSFQATALSTPLGIPIIYGVDAVHGHNNVQGATIFPHNIGLGATRDPGLVQQIGQATGKEVSGTGIDWSFAPCLCVARDDRWGRTYESFGEKPETATSMATIITGLQGSSLNGPASVLATAKHYVGDGGTTGGKDQGNTELSEADLRAIHLPPFREAVAQKVGSVMISYSSWNGVKMHANRYLVTDVLKGELGFSGFAVSDWQGVDKIDTQDGFTADEVRSAINAGIDMVMVPYDYKRFIDTLKEEVQAGRVSMSRIDDANRRILTKKFELGLFERPYTDRSYTSTVGSPAHRSLAREAVRKSQVLLKNKWNRVLPQPQTASKIFVAGKNADDVGNQSGGWTISWQGSSGNITPGTTILQGIRNTVAPGTTVTYDRYGNGIDGTYKAAIAVVGETPYAEWFGDRPGGMGLDDEDLGTLARLKASGVPVVVVLVSGRPLDIAGEIDDWDALVAAWLPGTEGQGVTDVLFGGHNPTGMLPVTWPRSASQQPINDGDGQTALFPYGSGLSYPATQNPYDIIGAVYYDAQQGTEVERCTDGGCGQNLAHVTAGDYVAYDGVDFGTTAPTRLLTRVASGATVSGTIEYRLDGRAGPVIATVPVRNSGGWQSWISSTVSVSGTPTGVHKLYLVFTGSSADDFVNVNWFQFSR
jgi:beta-glucosidase